MSAIIHVELQQAEQHHQSLVDNVRRFQTQLSHLLSDPTLDDVVVAQARDAIIEYLTRYIHDAEQPAARAADAPAAVLAALPACCPSSAWRIAEQSPLR